MNMSRLQSIQPKKTNRPARILIYGVEGVGKSTFGDNAPKPIFISPEGGTDELEHGVSMPGIKTYSDVIESVKELIAGKHEYKTVILDSADWIEKLCHAEIIGNSGKGINQVHGGYGAGLSMSEQKHKQLIELLSDLREKRDMNIVITAHYHVKKVKDPEAISDYDQFEIKCDERVSSLWREWVDCIFFARFETFVKSGEDGEKTIAKGSGERIMYTQKRPAFQAKNRYGLPFQLPVSWQAFEYARQAAAKVDCAPLILQAQDLAKKVTDTVLAEKIKTSIKGAEHKAEQLHAIIARIKDITGEQK